jgi:hypothetical protein
MNQARMTIRTGVGGDAYTLSLSRLWLLPFADLIADHATYDCAANGANGTSARQNSSADRTNASTYRGILTARQTAAARQRYACCYRYGSQCAQSVHFSTSSIVSQ